MTEANVEQGLDRKDLKIMHYKEKLNQLEEANADLRVELTILSQQLQQALAQIPAEETNEEEAAESADDSN